MHLGKHFLIMAFILLAGDVKLQIDFKVSQEMSESKVPIKTKLYKIHQA